MGKSACLLIRPNTHGTINDRKRVEGRVMKDSDKIHQSIVRRNNGRSLGKEGAL